MYFNTNTYAIYIIFVIKLVIVCYDDILDNINDIYNIIVYYSNIVYYNNIILSYIILYIITLYYI